MRPLTLSLIAITGVLIGSVLTVAAFVVAVLRTLQGITPDRLTIALLIGALLATVVIWFYWGLWEMIATAWWAHVVAGPLAIIGLVALTPMLPGLVDLVAASLPNQARQLLTSGVAWSLAGFIGLEGLTVIYLPTVRQMFGIGAPRKAWER
jgi:hypothetical protein